jgi:PKHD-type hydroxylase
MQIRIPKVLTAEQAAQCCSLLATADWVEGKGTAAPLTKRVKDNAQLPEGHPVARRLGEMISNALNRSEMFIMAALPLRSVAPMFNRYTGGQSYGDHVDATLRHVSGTRDRLRADLSATLFLTPPEDYDGGELVIKGSVGQGGVKLPAGDLMLYPTTSVHYVTPVTRGVRLASFFWIQSMVRDDIKREVLFELDSAMQRFSRDVPDNPAVVQLNGVYYNLLRMWSEV